MLPSFILVFVHTSSDENKRLDKKMVCALEDPKEFFESNFMSFVDNDFLVGLCGNDSRQFDFPLRACEDFWKIDFSASLKVEQNRPCFFPSLMLYDWRYVMFAKDSFVWKKIENCPRAGHWHLPQLPPVRPRHSLVSLFHRNTLNPSHLPSFAGRV